MESEITVEGAGFSSDTVFLVLLAGGVVGIAVWLFRLPPPQHSEKD